MPAIAALGPVTPRTVLGPVTQSGALGPVPTAVASPCAALGRPRRS